MDTRTHSYRVSRNAADLWKIADCRRFVRHAHPEYYWLFKGLRRAGPIREATRLILDLVCNDNPAADYDNPHRAHAAAA